MITMTPRALRYYHESRKPHYSKYHGRLFPGAPAMRAKQRAILRDRVETEFDDLEARGLVKFEVESDDCWDWENLVGDSYDECHADTVPGGMRTIKAQERESRKQVEQYGVFGLVSYALGEQVDSCWGFFGDYDEDYAGYGTDIKASAIDAVQMLWTEDQSGEH